MYAAQCGNDQLPGVRAAVHEQARVRAFFDRTGLAVKHLVAEPALQIFGPTSDGHGQRMIHAHNAIVSVKKSQRIHMDVEKPPPELLTRFGG
jgi:hypothetical protein